MTASDYQRAAARTLIDGADRTLTGKALMAVWTALGLAGEAGEVAEHVKKGVLHEHGVDRDALAGELGDVLWYVAGLATVYGIDLGAIMARNVAKLNARYPHGFTPADSIARRDTIDGGSASAYNPAGGERNG